MELSKFRHNKGTQLYIIRDYFEKEQIRSKFIVFDANDICIYSGVALELEFYNNFRDISAIPQGNYLGSKRNHRNFGNCIYINHVANRSGIYIHTGNLYSQIEGCVVVGNLFKDINNDSKKDVVNSAYTLHQLYLAMQTTFNITILENRFGFKSV